MCSGWKSRPLCTNKVIMICTNSPCRGFLSEGASGSGVFSCRHRASELPGSMFSLFKKGRQHPTACNLISAAFSGPPPKPLAPGMSGLTAWLLPTTTPQWQICSLALFCSKQCVTLADTMPKVTCGECHVARLCLSDIIYPA